MMRRLGKNWVGEREGNKNVEGGVEISDGVGEVEERGKKYQVKTKDNLWQRNQKGTWNS